MKASEIRAGRVYETRTGARFIVQKVHAKKGTRKVDYRLVGMKTSLGFVRERLRDFSAACVREVPASELGEERE